MRPGVLAVRFVALLDSQMLIVNAGTHFDYGPRRSLVDCSLDGLVDAIDGSISNLLIDNERRLPFESNTAYPLSFH